MDSDKLGSFLGHKYVMATANSQHHFVSNCFPKSRIPSELWHRWLGEPASQWCLACKNSNKIPTTPVSKSTRDGEQPNHNL